ncbi:MAG: hypothetical protein NCW75_15025 [Phycisphaera sp.]|nr:MAG: hypothetical protein NCW75_15025 [Phycisphaera sp.]
MPSNTQNPSSTSLPQAAQALTEGLIDYAGLFPPAKLDMAPAVENFARYLRSAQAPMLGRFVCPASRLSELTKAGQMLMPGTFATSGYPEMAGDGEPWRISAIVPHTSQTPLDDSLEQIREFNHRHEAEDQGLAIVDAIETPLKEVADVDGLLDTVPEQLAIAMEVPVAGGTDVRGYIAALAGTGAAAKIRCGGVTKDAMLPAEPIVEFIAACRTAGVPFKCTAGLHHALPGSYRLTYEDNPPMGPMQGFVNVFTAAILIGARAIDEQTAIELMAETNGSNFVLTNDTIGWKTHTVPVATAVEQRSRFALSFGSCSFEEPTEELAELLRAPADG